MGLAFYLRARSRNFVSLHFYARITVFRWNRHHMHAHNSTRKTSQRYAGAILLVCLGIRSNGERLFIRGIFFVSLRLHSVTLVTIYCLEKGEYKAFPRNTWTKFNDGNYLVRKTGPKQAKQALKWRSESMRRAASFWRHKLNCIYEAHDRNSPVNRIWIVAGLIVALEVESLVFHLMTMKP